jgi:beta-glucosidase
MNIKFDYAQGYKDEQYDSDSALIAEAVNISRGKDAVIIFAGLFSTMESEGYDRDNIDMPKSHIKLIEEVSKVSENVVVVLQCGSAVSMPWIFRVKGVLLQYLSGCQGGKAAAKLLFGLANPCGKLAETFPIHTEDSPCSQYYGKNDYIAEYRESIFTGYRYFETADKKVLFPFGFGLSYTDFDYSYIASDKLKLDYSSGTDKLKLSFSIKNKGEMKGKEIVQLYIEEEQSAIYRPKRELKGFMKFELEAGKSKNSYFVIDRSCFEFYNTETHKWEVESGKYKLELGSSSKDIKLSYSIEVKGDSKASDCRKTLPAYYNISKEKLDIDIEQFETLLHRKIDYSIDNHQPHFFNADTPVRELKQVWIGRRFISIALKMLKKKMKNDKEFGTIAEKMVMDMPLRSLSMGSDKISKYTVDGMVDIFNGKLFIGIKKVIKNK